MLDKDKYLGLFTCRSLARQQREYQRSRMTFLSRLGSEPAGLIGGARAEGHCGSQPSPAKSLLRARILLLGAPHWHRLAKARQSQDGFFLPLINLSPVPGETGQKQR